MPISAQPRPRIPKGDALFQTPAIAWPTVFLFVLAISIWFAGLLLSWHDILPYALILPIQVVAVFMLFTVLHDGVHRSLMRGYPGLNDLLANISGYFLTPLGSCAVFRVAHFAHHRHTNHPQDDPDMWSGRGKWLLPLRWMTADFAYIPVVVRSMSKISLRDKVEIIGSVVVLGTLYLLAWFSGWGVEATLYWLIPSRLAVLWLAFAVNYLPHHPHQILQSHNPYAATNVRAGGEPLMKWLFLYQNYHLIHHLFPSVPFYRYQAIWKKYGSEYQDKGAPVVPLLQLT